jgi:hypothetical protein
MTLAYAIIFILLVLPFLLERSYNFSVKDFDEFLKDENEKDY